jgi:predicted O-methyltransferase YrrM
LAYETSFKRQLVSRFDQPHYRLLRTLGLFEIARGANRWIHRIKCERRALRGEGLVPEERLREVFRDCLLRLRDLEPGRPPGDYLEFGVAYGSSMACMHEAQIQAGVSDMRLFGFDSFEGLPPEADHEEAHGWFSGQIQSTQAFARKLLTRRGVDWSRTALIKGWFRDTLTEELRQEYDINHASVIMIDSDLYSSAVEVLAFCKPLMGRHTIILFDEWNAYGLASRNEGEKRAFDEFLARYPQFATEPLPSYNDNSAVFLVTDTTANTNQQ